MAKDLGPILLLLNEEDLSYIRPAKVYFAGIKTFVITAIPQHIGEIEHYARTQGVTRIISTSVSVLNTVVASSNHQNLDSWAGSLFDRNGITYLFLNPLRQFYSVPYGQFLFKRFISKITEPNTWPKTPQFRWGIARTDNIEDVFRHFSKSLILACDIETVNFEHPEIEDEIHTIIRCMSFSGLFPDGSIDTIVIPLYESPHEEHEFWKAWISKFMHLKIPKIFQNGLYDTGHLLTYGITGWGYFWDTQSLFHSWYSELPKRLDFQAAFCVHNIFYWKDMARGANREKLFEYNARDTWATLCIFIYLITHMPEWAFKNYLIKFPLWVPCLAGNLEGVKVNANIRNALIEKYKGTFEDSRARLNKWLGGDFNPNSPTQVKKLIHFYGSTDLDSSDDRALSQFALRHPLNARFAEGITEARESGKIISTYLKPSDYSVARKPTRTKSRLLKHGRLFYTQNPDGTDTARLSCSEGIFWVGTQIQNQPESVKEMYVPDEGFEMFELDNTTSESYCTGYISGDENLIATLQSGKDFHALNASKFFGISYDEIVDAVGKVLNKEIRNLSKRTNHGANYNMQAGMLLATMGEKNVDRAKKLLGFPSYYTRLMVCEALLKIFDTTYPTIRGPWYDSIKTIIPITKTVTSALGWTRYCFGNPAKSKPDLNAYVAHQPQNLSVGIINEAYKKIYWEVQHKYPREFRLKAQIHDSIWGQSKERELILKARKIAEQTIPVKDFRGKVRNMTIPVVAKVGPNWLNMEKLAWI